MELLGHESHTVTLDITKLFSKILGDLFSYILSNTFTVRAEKRIYQFDGYEIGSDVF